MLEFAKGEKTISWSTFLLIAISQAVFAVKRRNLSEILLIAIMAQNRAYFREVF
jgi:hypothetical protein